MSQPVAQASGGSYRLIAHTADMGIEVHGGSLAALFEQAAFGLLAVLGGEQVVGREERVVEVTGYEVEEVLVNWLNELLYLVEIQTFLPAAFVMEAAGRQSVRARVQGETYDPAGQRLEREIKAVTYHQLQVVEENGCWRARLFVDL